MEAGRTQEFEFIGVKQEQSEEPEDVGMKQETLEDQDNVEFLPQEPECILEQQDEERDGDVVHPTQALEDPLYIGDPSLQVKQEHELKYQVDDSKHSEAECIIVQKEDGSGVGEQEGAPTQMHENGVRQKPPDTAGGREEDEEAILGLVPKVEWVPPSLPAGEEAVTDPQTCEGDAAFEFVGVKQEPLKEPEDDELLPQVTDSMNEECYAVGWSHTSDKNWDISSGEAGPPFNSFGARRCKSDGTELVRQAFRCDSCSAIFSAKYHLVYHVFTHIPEVPPPSHVCRRCGEVFCDTAALVEHSKGHENGPEVPAVIPERRRPRRPDGGVRKCVKTKPHVCDQCGKAFAYLGNLTSHELTHSGERPYTCGVCGRCFAQWGHLQNHRVTHTAEKRYYCEFCGRAFSLLHTLKVHLRLHTGDNPYRCEACGKAFNLLSKLKTHELIHSGTKPYACEECGASFASVNNLKRHRRKHSGEKPYRCDACGEAFMWYATLQRHKQLHTGEKPFKCDLCPGAFAEMGGLNRHMRTHAWHTEKRFKCHLCVSSFVELGGLNRHMRCHRGERPYACDHCGAAFTAVNHLRRHQNKEHAESTAVVNVSFGELPHPGFSFM